MYPHHPNLIFLHPKPPSSLTDHRISAKIRGIIAPRGQGYKYSQSNKRYIPEPSSENQKPQRKRDIKKKNQHTAGHDPTGQKDQLRHFDAPDQHSCFPINYVAIIEIISRFSKKHTIICIEK